MKNKVHGEQNLNNSYLLLDVELIPENEQEKEAVRQVEALSVNEDQRELVENYLLFGLKIPYSVSVEKQNNNRFILKASIHKA